MDELIHAIIEYVKNNSLLDLVITCGMAYWVWQTWFGSDEDCDCDDLREENEELKEQLRDLRTEIRRLKRNAKV